MSRNIWVTSDTHYNHANILKFKNGDGSPTRDFGSLQEMNETMINNWNSVVRPGDIVYHLGDVVFGFNKDEWLATQMPRLKGKKRLVLGNHDDPKHFVGCGQFSKVMMWRKFPEFGLLLTHVPVHESTLKESRFGRGKTINVHGHIHRNNSPSELHHCVCVEQTNYTPVNIEDIKQ